MSSEQLFAYGTLQSEQVQLATFGRKLDGTPDDLPGFRLTTIEIADRDFVAKSGAAIHRNLLFTGNPNDSVGGTVLTLSHTELEQADAYEPAGYERMRVQLKSGTGAWIYLAKSS